VDIQFHGEKFRQLILFVAQESEDDPKFGATKLNKILYFSDFKAFGILGEPITGATYQRLERGPAPREMLPMLREMEAEGSIRREERRYFNLLQKRVLPEARPDLSVFSGDELELVRNVIRELRHLNALDVSALSHLEVGWQIADPGAVIPYAMVYISARKPTRADFERYQRDLHERTGARS